MDFHLDRRLRLKTKEEIEHPGLHEWAIVEFDEHGDPVGRDFIPWRWSLHFHGTEIVLADRVGFDHEGDEGHIFKHSGSSTIQVRLKPLSTRDGKIWGREPSYSMFGCDRYVSDFTLRVVAAVDGLAEGSSAWASVSYTSEIDFRQETESDAVQFTLVLPQTSYDRLVWNLARGLVDEVALAVSWVDGFYSDWSPGISTDLIKILAGDEHVVEGAKQDSLPRVGNVGKAELTFAARRQLRQPTAAFTSSQSSARSDDDEEAVGDRPPAFRWPGRRRQ